MVVNMEVDKVADMVTGHGCWLVEPKPFQPEPYHPTCVSSKLCDLTTSEYSRGGLITQPHMIMLYSCNNCTGGSLFLTNRFRSFLRLENIGCFDEFNLFKSSKSN